MRTSILKALTATCLAALTTTAIADNVTSSPPKVYAAAGQSFTFDVNFAMPAAVASTDLRINYGPTTASAVSNVFAGCIDAGTTPAPYDGGGFKYILWLDSSTSAFPTSTACGSGTLTSRAATFTGTAPAPFPGGGAYSIQVVGFTDDPNSTANDVTVCQKRTVTGITAGPGVTEGAAATYTIQLDANVVAGCEFVVPVTFSGTATNAPDNYSTAAVNASCAAGNNFCTVTSSAGTNDTVADGTKTLTANIAVAPATADYVNTAARTADASILDDEVSISVTATNTAEGGANAVVTFARGGSTAATQQMTSNIGGSATYTTDYTLIAGATNPCTINSQSASAITVTVPVNAATCTVEVQPVNDTLVEVTETVTFAIPTAAAPAISAGSAATVNITDNDSLPSVSITKGADCAEPATNCAFTVTVTSNTNPVQTGAINGVSLTLGGTATPGAGNDYTIRKDACDGAELATTKSTFTTNLLNVGANTVVVCVVDDLTKEGTETVTLQVNTNAVATATTVGAVSLNIADDDGPQTVSVAASGSPAEQGAVTGKFTLTRAGGSVPAQQQALTVNVTLGGTATYGAACTTAGVDYMLSVAAPVTASLAAAPRTVTFPAGNPAVLTADITVTPCNDAVVDPAETVTLAVAADSVAAPNQKYDPASTTPASLTIIDDDVAVNAVAGNTGTATVLSTPEGNVVRFSVSCPTLATAQSINFSITPATAYAGDVYSGSPTGSVTCPAAAASLVAVPTTVQTINDTTIGNARTYTMTISIPQVMIGAANNGLKAGGPAVAATIIGNAVATVNVTDDDQPVNVPTMSMFGLGFMSLMLAGFVAFQRRRVQK